MAEYIPTNSTFVNPYSFIDLIHALKKRFNNYRDLKAKGNLTGWLECKLETKTPIFIPNTTKTFMQKVSDGEMKCYDFFSYNDLNQQSATRIEDLPLFEPIIPGSEIRGMIRSAFEAVTKSCLSTIDDEQLLYKRVQTPAKPGPARLVFENNQWKIIECTKYRLPKSWISQKFPKILINGQDYNEGQEVFVSVHPKNFKVIAISPTKSGNLKPGFLHIGEYNDNKNYEAIFVPQQQPNKQYVLNNLFSNDMIPKMLANLLENVLLYRAKQNKTKNHQQYRHFPLDERSLQRAVRLAQRHDITAEQFAASLPNKVFAYLNGALIYFVKRRGIHGERWYLSPAAIGREVFYNKLTDLIKEFTPCTRIDQCCETCALFGMVGMEANVKQEDRAAASRVCFTDAHVQGAHQFGQPQTLQELASPKLSATEFYLKKPQGADVWNYDYAVNWRNAKEGLANYQPEIRGRKFYWHHAPTTMSPYLDDPDSATIRHVHVRPLNYGKFTFKVYFNNITETELQKLLWVLEIGGRESHAHKIGMGKPLGLGSVQIRVDAIKQREVRIDAQTVAYALNDVTKPDYAMIAQKFINPTILEEFLKITDFDHAFPNVAYPNNEQGEAYYEWFMANKVVHPSATGTSPILYQTLPELAAQSQFLKKYRTPANKSGSPQIRIETKFYTAESLLAMIQKDQLVLTALFEHQGKEWNDNEQSRFIESLLIRIPLPVFYLAIEDDNTWRVVDGMERLKTLQRFIVAQEFTLTNDINLLPQFREKKFGDLPGMFQRKLRETQFTVHVIEKGTPKRLMFEIFERMNMTVA